MALDCNCVEVGDPALTPTLRRVRRYRLARPAEMAEHGQPARTPSETGQEPGDRGRRAAVLRQRQHTPAGRQVQPQTVERTRVQADRRAVGERPAEPGGGETERARIRHDRHFVDRKTARQRGPDAVPQGLAARQHRDPPAAPCRDHLDRGSERATPRRFARHRSRAPSPDAARRRPTPPRSRPRHGAAADRPARPSSPMPTTASHRVIAGSRAR